jgi:pSer/pThr/pTyr-binding forkhead associated (FHA) protein
MRISVTVRNGSEAASSPGLFHYAFDQPEVLIGRDEAVEVRLPHPSVSLVHCRLIRKDRRIYLLDAGSTNGTRLDGRAIPAGQLVPVDECCRILIGPFELLLEQTSTHELTRPTDTAAFARRMVLGFMGLEEGGDVCSLQVTRGPEKGSRLVIPPLSRPLIIGRGSDCDLKLSDADTSRRHLEVCRLEETIQISDLGSKNGFLVNGRSNSDPCSLRHGDEVIIGQTALLFTHPTERYLQELRHEAAPSLEQAPKPAEPATADDVGDPAGCEGDPSSSMRPRRTEATGRIYSVLAVGAAVLAALALIALAYVLI